MNFNEKLLTLRKNAGMSQDALAEKLGVTRQAVSKWELGTAMPETENIAKLAQIFDVTADYLLGHTVVEKPNVISGLKKIKNTLKQHGSTILFIIYIILMALFLFNMRIFTINCARAVTHSIKPFFWWTMAEYKAYRKRPVGMGDLEYALYFLAFAGITFMLMKIIRKKDRDR